MQSTTLTREQEEEYQEPNGAGDLRPTGSESPLEAAAEFDESLQVFSVLKYSTQTAGSGSYKCAHCGFTGHNKRTCPSRVMVGHSTPSFAASTETDPNDYAVFAFESPETRDSFVQGITSAAGGAPTVMQGKPGVRIGLKAMPMETLLQRKAELEAMHCNSGNPNVLQKDTVTHNDLLLALGAPTSAGPMSGRHDQSSGTGLRRVNMEVSRRINNKDPRPAHIAAGHNRPECFGQKEASDLQQVCKSVCAQLGIEDWEFGARKQAGKLAPRSFWPQVTREFYGSQYTEADESEQGRLLKKVKKYEEERTRKSLKVFDPAGSAGPGTP